MESSALSAFGRLPESGLVVAETLMKPARNQVLLSLCALPLLFWLSMWDLAWRLLEALQS